MSRIQCLCCNHYQFSKKCKAFPKGIPNPIYLGDVDHSQPYDGDHDIRFVWLEASDSGAIKKPFLKKIRIDHKPREGELEHYTTANYETREILGHLVVELPSYLIAKRRGGPKKTKAKR